MGSEVAAADEVVVVLVKVEPIKVKVSQDLDYPHLM